MVDDLEFIVEAKDLDETTYYGFPARQDAQSFVDEIESRFPTSEILIGPSIIKSNMSSKVYESGEDFELQKTNKISFCKK